MSSDETTDTLRDRIEVAMYRRFGASACFSVYAGSRQQTHARAATAAGAYDPGSLSLTALDATDIDALRALALACGLRVETCGACNGRGRHAYGREAEDGCDECECAGIVVVDHAADAFDRLVARVWRAATGDTHEGPASVDVLLAAVEGLRRERERLQRACDEGLPRERIDCPACGLAHVEGPRHDDPSVDGRTRPHHTHRCYHCGHVWDAGRWSFGVAEGEETAVAPSDVARLDNATRGAPICDARGDQRRPWLTSLPPLAALSSPCSRAPSSPTRGSAWPRSSSPRTTPRFPQRRAPVYGLAHDPRRRLSPRQHRRAAREPRRAGARRAPVVRAHGRLRRSGLPRRGRLGRRVGRARGRAAAPRRRHRRAL